MKKYILKATLVAAIAAIAAWNINKTMEAPEMSDLALANVEALANGESMTPEEYYEMTGGCIACWEKYHNCKGKDGKTYLYSHKEGVSCPN